MESRDIRYRFTFGDGRREEFAVRLEPTPFEPLGALPPWTALDFNRCCHCPLDETLHAHCPVAVRLVQPVAQLGDVLSYDRVKVEVFSDERTTTQETTAQTGLSSMMGLVIATSGCPHTAYFRPMARFHLPFASEEETVYRAATMYLLGQYFRGRAGGEVDTGFDGLREIYQNMQTLNREMARRLRAASKEDSTVNAIVLLDMFTMSLQLAVDGALDELRHLFSPYLLNAPKPELAGSG